ncbi:MAG TPA: hypothetical protein PLS07_09700 [Niabella sp.]|nr:hypothetical protein [Niabella sp.]HQW13928.1 hypothetical protein [Niabella sp.]HQX19179.1 hypothetical protein [Niabella sp.]HRB34331.1 hypothetical protein [Niabella sp.]HRB47426.1 hypothetical protein [Niabella sp.]
MYIKRSIRPIKNKKYTVEIFLRIYEEQWILFLNDPTNLNHYSTLVDITTEFDRRWIRPTLAFKLLFQNFKGGNISKAEFMDLSIDLSIKKRKELGLCV